MTNETPASEALRDWPEDSAHENGNYLNFCSRCGWEFQGHKRRVVCKACASPSPPAGGGEPVAWEGRLLNYAGTGEPGPWMPISGPCALFGAGNHQIRERPPSPDAAQQRIRELEGTVAARDGHEAQRGLNDIFPGDPYPVESVLADIRQRHVQAIGAGLSRRDWHATETAYNGLRDAMDDLLRRIRSRARTALGGGHE